MRRTKVPDPARPRPTPSPAGRTTESLTGTTVYGGACRGCGAALPPFSAQAGDRRRVEESRAMLRSQGWDLERGLCPECVEKFNHQDTKGTESESFPVPEAEGGIHDGI